MLKLGTHVDSGQIYDEYRNQALQFLNINIYVTLFLKNCEA